VPRLTIADALGMGDVMQDVEKTVAGWKSIPQFGQPKPTTVARAVLARFFLPFTRVPIGLATRGINIGTAPVTSVVRGVGALARGQKGEAAGRAFQFLTS